MQTEKETAAATLAEQIERAKRESIKRALLATNCNIAQAAIRLGVQTTHLYRNLRRFGWIERGPVDRAALHQHLVAMGESAEG